jgi:hypothetical protein
MTNTIELYRRRCRFVVVLFSLFLSIDNLKIHANSTRDQSIDRNQLQIVSSKLSSSSFDWLLRFSRWIHVETQRTKIEWIHRISTRIILSIHWKSTDRIYCCNNCDNSRLMLLEWEIHLLWYLLSFDVVCYHVGRKTASFSFFLPFVFFLFFFLFVLFFFPEWY